MDETKIKEEPAELKDSDFDGRLVYLTRYLEKWYRDLSPEFDVPMSNRLARVIKVFDWNTEEGKLVTEARRKTGKWSNKIIAEDFKFVLKIYFPELTFKDKNKVTAPEVVPRYYPGTKMDMFCLLPVWMLKDLNKEEKNLFKVERK
jgi:hypothetical protein